MPTSCETSKCVMIDAMRLDGADEAKAARRERRSAGCAARVEVGAGTVRLARASPRRRRRSSSTRRESPRLTGVEDEQAGEAGDGPAVPDAPGVRVERLAALDGDEERAARDRQRQQGTVSACSVPTEAQGESRRTRRRPLAAPDPSARHHRHRSRPPFPPLRPCRRPSRGRQRRGRSRSRPSATSATTSARSRSRQAARPPTMTGWRRRADGGGAARRVLVRVRRVPVRQGGRQPLRVSSERGVCGGEREGKRASTGQSWMAFSSHGERESFGPRTEHFAAHK